MKLALIFALLFLSLSVHANEKGNGGDSCEDHFKIVRDDLQSWIIEGGGTALTLPAAYTHADYNSRMLTALRSADISCVDRQILVGKKEKTCVNFRESNGKMHIICNRKDFMKTSEDDQYVLVHHEYAGLTGIEKTAAGSSNYSISNQISSYLETKAVRHLVVKAGGWHPTSTAQCATFLAVNQLDGVDRKTSLIRGPTFSPNGRERVDLAMPDYPWISFSAIALKDSEISLNLDIYAPVNDSKANAYPLSNEAEGLASGRSYTQVVYHNEAANVSADIPCRIFEVRVLCAANLQLANKYLFRNLDRQRTPFEPDNKPMPKNCFP